MSVGLLPSCTKESDYTIKGLQTTDPEVTFFEDGINLPLDTTLTIKLSEVITTGNELKTDVNGNYYIESKGSVKDTTITIPAVTIQKPEISEFNVVNSTGSYAGKTLPTAVDEPVGDAISQSFSISLTNSLSEEVIDIKSIDLSANVDLTLKESTGLLKLPAGFKVVFPEGLTFVKNDQQDWYSVATANGITTLSFVNPKTMGANNLVCHLRLTHMDVKSSWLDIQNKRIVFSENVTVSGQPWIKASAGTKVPDGLNLKINGTVGNITVSEVSAKATTTAKISQKSIDIRLPKEIKDAHLKLENPVIKLFVSNYSPFEYAVKATLKGEKNGQSVASPVAISFTVAANAGQHTEEIKGAGITAIIEALPDKLIITDIEVKAQTPDWISIASKQQYNLSMSYSVYAPLTLLKNSDFSFDKEIKNDLKLEEKVSLNSVKLKFTAYNNIPLELKMYLKMYVNGELVDVVPDDGHQYFEFDAADIQGSSEEVVAVILTEEAVTELGNVQISATATATGEKATINKNQSFEIKLNGIYVEDGVTVDTSEKK